NVGGTKAGDASDGAGDDRAGGIDTLDEDVAQERVFTFLARAESHEDGRAHILHADVGDDHAVDAAAIDCLNVDAADDAVHHGAAVVAVDDGVREDDILEDSAGGGAHLKTVAGAGDDAVGDGDVLGGLHFAAVRVFALKADGVVAPDDVAVGYEDVAAAGDVHPVGIAAVKRVADADAVDKDCLAVDRAQGPAGRVFERDAANADVVARDDLHHGGRACVVVFGLVMAGGYVVPGLIGRGRGTIRIRLPPGFPVAVDGAEAAEGDVFGVARKDDVIAVNVAASPGKAEMVFVVAEVRAAKQDASCFDIERHAALQLESTDEKGSRRCVNEASTRLEDFVD